MEPAQVSPWHTYLFDPLERATSTFVEQFGVLLVPLLLITQQDSGSRISISSSQLISVVDISGFAFLISIITSVTTFIVKPQAPLLDLFWRVFKTYLQSFLATVTTSSLVPTVLHASWEVAALGAIPVALAALVKGLTALELGYSIGPSLIPVLYSRPREPVVESRHHRPANQPPSFEIED